MAKISIIVPVYNCENFISRCIDSILAQTFTDFELLIIDDGSTDCSGTICDKFSETDKRIRVIHQPNQGVSTARNTGIEFSSGEYITFIDADDYVLPNFLSDFNISESDFDLAVQGNINTYTYLGTSEVSAYEKTRTIDFKNFLDNPKRKIWSPWAKLYRRRIIIENNIYFNTLFEYGEDRVFVAQYMVHCKSFREITSESYVYTHENPICLTSKKHSWTKLYEYIIAFFHIIKYITDHWSLSKETNMELKRNVSSDFFHALVTLLQNNESFKEKFTTLKMIDPQLIHYVNTCEALPKTYHIIQLLYKYLPKFVFLLIANSFLKAKTFISK